MLNTRGKCFLTAGSWSSTSSSCSCPTCCWLGTSAASFSAPVPIPVSSCRLLENGTKNCCQHQCFYYLLLVLFFTGIITKSNHASLMKIYAYDGALFQKGVRCPTCDMEKPARSKHCRKNLTCLASITVMYSQISSLSVTAVHTIFVLLPHSVHTGFCSFLAGSQITAALCPFTELFGS